MCKKFAHNATDTTFYTVSIELRDDCGGDDTMFNTFCDGTCKSH